jgi:hypothetical protein
LVRPITIEAEANQYPLGIERVEFLIDGTLKYTDVEVPYAWTWKNARILQTYRYCDSL